MSLPADDKAVQHHAWLRLLTPKIVRIMKLTGILLIIGSLHLSAGTRAQSTVTLTATNEKLQKVLLQIQQQTGYEIFFNDALMAKSNPVTITIKQASLEDALQQCFRNQPLTYSIIAKTVVIKDKLSPPQKQLKLPVEINGHVINEQGQPISGANVIIRRTKRGTITNANGDFILTGVNPDDVITITFIGYAPQTIKSNEKNVEVILKIATNDLDKVVIQAYGQTSQRLNTGNIATVSAAEIERQPVMNPLQALQGKIPGLVVQQTSGYASAPFKIELRGRSVINNNRPSEPLYIVDGVPLTVLELNGGNYETGSTGFLQNGLAGPAGGQSPFFSINPNDIESISVLKDADATAIYGSRGANGVIIITTKKGKAGKTIFDLTAYQGISLVTRHYRMLNTQQYLDVRRQAFNNDGVTADGGNAFDLLSWDTSRYTDWQKYLWGGQAKTSDAQLSISGGDKQTIFRIGGAYHHETDIMTVSGSNQRAAIQFNISHKSLNQRLSLSLTSTYSYTKSNLINIAGAVTLPPNAPSVWDEQGKLNWAGWGTGSYLYPFSSLLQPFTSKTGLLNSQFTAQYELFKGLILSTRLGYSSFHGSQIYLQPIASQNPLVSNTGVADFGNDNNSNAIVEPQVEYKTFVGQGSLSVLAGASVQSVSQDGNHIQGIGYVNDNLLHSISNAPQKNASDVYGQYKYAAVFGRATYNFKDKYILNLTARRDGSSRFGPGRQFGNFGSIGGAWIFTEEKWFQDHLPFLSFGKLRGSYGLTGSDNIGDYQFLSQWSGAATPPYQEGRPSYLPGLHANPNLEWQTNRKLEAALSMGFLEDKITMEIAWYRNLCGNQLVSIPLPLLTGFPTVTSNLPATIQNSGVEGYAKGIIVAKKSFEWTVNANIGINWNKLIAFPNLSQSPYASLLVIGQSLNLRKQLHYTGVSQQTGLYMFDDRNKDGSYIINSNDTTNDLFNNNMSIDFEGGFGTDLRFRGLQLSLFFRVRQLPLPDAIASKYPGNISNQSTQILNHWQKEGDVSQYARYTTAGDNTDFYFYNFSDGPYSKVFYIRLQNISISYDFPTLWANKAGMTGAKIFARGENLFLITTYNGVDPDVPSFGALPPSKVFTAGVQFNF